MLNNGVYLQINCIDYGEIKKRLIQYQILEFISCLSMWATNSLQQLKTQVLKAKSYKSKAKDAQLYMVAFEKYFNTVRTTSNCQKVIEYFVQIFVACLHLNPHQKINEVYKKLLFWLTDDPNSKVAYLLVKTIVEIAERQFADYFNRQNALKVDKKMDKSKQREKSKDRDRENSRSISKQRQKQRKQSVQRQRKQKQLNPQIMKANLKALLTLIRKSGEKNMMNQDIYQVFLDYYLQRIQKQIDQLSKPSSNGKKLQNKSTIPLGSYILSELSCILANRNKTQVVPSIKKHLQQVKQSSHSACISIYILLQFRNIPNLISPILSPINLEVDIIRHHEWLEKLLEDYVKDFHSIENSKKKINSSVVLILQKYFEIVSFCVKNGLFETFVHLYKLYPLNCVTQIHTCEQLLDRIYIHLFLNKNQLDMKKGDLSTDWQRWKKQFINDHIQYIQSTKIAPINVVSERKNILNIQYVLKLYILSIYYLNPNLLNNQNHQKLKKQLESIMDLLKKQIKIKKRSEMDEEAQQMEKKTNSFFQSLQLICQDYISIVRSANQGQNGANNPQIMNKIQSLSFQDKDKLLKNKQQQELYKKYTIQLSECLQDNTKSGAVKQKIRQSLLQQSIPDYLLLERWKLYMQSMFKQVVNQINENQQTKKSAVSLQYYNRQALHTMSLLSIKPGILVRKKQPHNEMICNLTNLSLACVEILEIIVNSIDKDDVASHIKRLMSETFDKVDQQKIRDVIVKDIFLSRCLLLTNHMPKCKYMIELLLRSGQVPKNKNITQLQKYLQKLFKNVPRQIIFQYCKYIVNRDKLQFRLGLYQKNMTHLQHLLEMNLYEVLMKPKSTDTNQTPAMFKL